MYVESSDFAIICSAFRRTICEIHKMTGCAFIRLLQPSLCSYRTSKRTGEVVRYNKCARW